MDLYVGNIPTGLTVKQLKAFFKGFDKQASFNIRRLKGKHQLYVFGFVSIPNDSLAKKAIKRLNLKRIDGKLINVREFVHRASQNDRRRLNWRTEKWLARERRNNERRTIRLPRIKQHITYAA